MRAGSLSWHPDAPAAVAYRGQRDLPVPARADVAQAAGMFDRLLRALFPGACLLCDLTLPTGAGVDLCADCHRALPWNVPACRHCALPLPTNLALAGVCATCEWLPPRYSAALAPLLYTGPVPTWIRQLKDHLGLVEGRTLGLLLAAAAAGFYAGQRRPDVLIPVPLAWSRLARRGHNQALALALPLGRALGIPVQRTGVRRVRRTPPQRGLALDQRLHNLIGAFATRHSWAGLTVGLVDDVLTSGATVSELTDTLLDAGAAEVHVLCAARAVRDRRR
jgi:ComF family protein